MSEKKITRQQMNFFRRLSDNLRQILRETIGELRKVNWPTRQEAFNLTKVVLIVIIGMSFFLGVLDLIFAGVFRLLLGA